jgi:hypothetical protein
LYRVARSTTFLFITLCTSIQISGENRGQTGALRVNYGRERAPARARHCAPAARQRCPPRHPSRPRAFRGPLAPSQHSSLLARATRMPRPSRAPRSRTIPGLPHGPSAVAGHARSRGAPIHPLVAGRLALHLYRRHCPINPVRRPSPRRTVQSAGAKASSHGELRALARCVPNQPCHHPSRPLP